MSHDPKIMVVHRDFIRSLAYFAVVEEMEWFDVLAIHRLSITDLVVDYKDASLVKGYTPVITRLCRDLRTFYGIHGNVDVVMEQLLDKFRFFRALYEGAEMSETRI